MMSGKSRLNVEPRELLTFLGNVKGNGYGLLNCCLMMRWKVMASAMEFLSMVIQ